MGWKITSELHWCFLWMAGEAIIHTPASYIGMFTGVLIAPLPIQLLANILWQANYNGTNDLIPASHMNTYMEFLVSWP